MVDFVWMVLAMLLLTAAVGTVLYVTRIFKRLNSLSEAQAEQIGKLSSSNEGQATRIENLERQLRHISYRNGRVPAIEVNRVPLIKTPNGRAVKTSSKHTSIRRFIEQSAAEFCIDVRQNDAIEGRTSYLRGSFLEESDRLRESIPDINIPRTENYSSFMQCPMLPVMAKLKQVSRGRHKYLLEDAKQVEKFESWLKNYGNPDEWIFQQFVKCPSDFYSTFRVIVDCLGRVQTSQILYGAPKQMNLRPDGARNSDGKYSPLFFLEDKQSDYFLNSRVVASNNFFFWKRTPTFYRDFSGGIYEISLGRDDAKYDEWRSFFNEDGMIGGRIVLDPIPESHPYSDRELTILEAYGLGTVGKNSPTMPTEVKVVASAIGKQLGIQDNIVKELFLGVDFIKDVDSGRVFVLEWNRRPTMEGIRDFFGGVDRMSEMDAYKWLIGRVIEGVARHFDFRGFL